MKVKDATMQAYPFIEPAPDDAIKAYHPGMTMRDEFAKAALPAVIAHWAECIIEDQRSEDGNTITGLTLSGNEGGAPLGIAHDAYAIADAMLKARKQ